MAYTYRPHWYDIRSYDPYGYWGLEDSTSVFTVLTEGIIFVYKEDDRPSEFTISPDRFRDFIFEDEREFTFVYTDEREVEYEETTRIIRFETTKDNSSMARVFYTEKQPNEYLTYVIDFSEELGTGEIITDVDATAIDEDGTSCWSTIGAGTSVADDGLSVSLGVKEGTEGYRYHINVICTLNSTLPNTTDYTKLEADLYVTVAEL